MALIATSRFNTLTAQPWLLGPRGPCYAGLPGGHSLLPPALAGDGPLCPPPAQPLPSVPLSGHSRPVLAQPDGGEVPGAQALQHLVAPVEHVSLLRGVVASCNNRAPLPRQAPAPPSRGRQADPRGCPLPGAARLPPPGLGTKASNVPPFPCSPSSSAACSMPCSLLQTSRLAAAQAPAKRPVRATWLALGRPPHTSPRPPPRPRAAQEHFWNFLRAERLF